MKNTLIQPETTGAVDLAGWKHCPALLPPFAATFRLQDDQEKAVDFAGASAATPQRSMKPEILFPAPFPLRAFIASCRLSARACLHSVGDCRGSAGSHPVSDRSNPASAESRSASDGRCRSSAERHPAFDLLRPRSDGFHPASDQSCPASDASCFQLDTTFRTTS